jgi:hypothetical protein
VIVFDPDGSVVVVQVATPLDDIATAEHPVIPPPVNATVPPALLKFNGIEAPAGALTVAVKVTESSKLVELLDDVKMGDCEETSAIELAAWLTVIVVVPLTTLTFGSPLYAATMVCVPAVSFP